MLYVGFDHSLTAFGLAAVRPDWELDFRRVRRVTLGTGTSDGAPVERRCALARDAVEWIRRQTVEPFVPFSAVRVFIEGGVFQRGMSETIRGQERLVGVLEHELFVQLGIHVEVLEQRALRTTFMGPSASGGRGAGDAAQELLKAAVPATTSWHEAELDAFLVVNHALSLAGEAFISCAPQVEPKPKKRRRAA